MEYFRVKCASLLDVLVYGIFKVAVFPSVDSFDIVFKLPARATQRII